MTNLTLVVPVFNETHRWPDKYWQDLLLLEWIHWIFVDDGSTDKTFELLTKLPLPSRYEVLRLPKNQGKGEAVRAGFLHFFESNRVIREHQGSLTQQSNELIGFVDADGSFSKSDISRIYEIAKLRIGLKGISLLGYGSHEIDSVWSSRVALNGRRIERTLARHYIGRIINTVLSPFIHQIPYDPQCGFKIFEATENFEKIISTPFNTRWFFDIEIILRWEEINDSKISIWEEPLDSWKETSGSHLALSNVISIMKEILLTFFSARKLNQKLKRSRNGS